MENRASTTTETRAIPYPPSAVTDPQQHHNYKTQQGPKPGPSQPSTRAATSIRSGGHAVGNQAPEQRTP
ncbi:hypothetical protein GCM10012275_56000 [Longimycelium tulufanense]|uniref:Uncharacterized protein n=1 Tax=Longimycelium tulufanense TaxID=907463 RepID=A0A8J3CDH6_9PSEU|nr:hypothetical protein GCM10012275_56000 [Longimycelium tulufanense]